MIDAYQPDVIHCWGSELCFGLIAKYTDIPVVMHIQGIINPIYDAYCPAGMSGYSILKPKALVHFPKMTNQTMDYCRSNIRYEDYH